MIMHFHFIESLWATLTTPVGLYARLLNIGLFLGVPNDNQTAYLTENSRRHLQHQKSQMPEHRRL